MEAQLHRRRSGRKLHRRCSGGEFYQRGSGGKLHRRCIGGEIDRRCRGRETLACIIIMNNPLNPSSTSSLIAFTFFFFLIFLCHCHNELLYFSFQKFQSRDITKPILWSFFSWLWWSIPFFTSFITIPKPLCSWKRNK